MSITDEDINNLLFIDEIKEFLHYISKEDIEKKIIVNIILIIFYSEHKSENISPVDWIKEIIIIMEEENITSRTLVPSLRDTHGIKLTLNDIVNKIYDLNKYKEISFNDCYVTYDMFNEYLDVLYEWFKDNFEIN